MATYALFLPPLELQGKDVKTWTKKEAQKYFEWFVVSKNLRLRDFKSFISEEEDIVSISQKTYNSLKDNDFVTYENEEYAFTNQGFALAADFGICLGEIILFNRKDLKWGLVKTSKHDPSFNLPVVAGYSSYPTYFDPIRVSITNWNQIINNKEDISFFKKLIEFSIAKL